MTKPHLSFRSLLLLVLSVAMIVPMGCSRNDRDRPLQLGIPFQMTVSGQRFLLRSRLSSIRLRKQLEDELRKSKHVELDGSKKKSKHSYQLEISVGIRRHNQSRRRRQPKILRALVLVTGQLTPLGKGRESIVMEERAQLTFRPLRPPTIDQMQGAILFAWRKLSHSLKVFAQLRRQKDKQVLAALDSPDTIIQRHAAYVLGRRKTKAAALTLIARLQSKDERVVSAAVGALVRLKDQRAALPLIKASTHRPPAFLMQVISALSVLGGYHAQSYLFTLANAHDDKRVRQSAHEGLQEIEKRAKPTARTSPAAKRSKSG